MFKPPAALASAAMALSGSLVPDVPPEFSRTEPLPPIGSTAAVKEEVRC